MRRVDENPSFLDVAVKVTGLPESCLNTTFYQNINCGLGVPNLVSEYENVSFNDEKLQLDKLNVELQNNPHAYGFIVRLFPNKVSRITVYQDLQRILNYLQTKGGDTSRIVFNLGYNATYQTKIFTISPGVEQPSEWGDELLYANTLADKLKSTKTKTKKSGN